ncbi:transcriptional regulator BetI [Rhizobium sp. BK376]|jgi:TetR/AcrR family transcriptional repressor of bet genes|uniref:transcriptional regulator BetI n=1 Tax=Rhizobium sp. BK376 TaxID=2512149 RepID=UPI00104E095D|nr:transcriptional regulator BetI [Rhizobium sp. BK376]TCR93377.1 TetR family transcriptional regulator [Rhizobium sp. BK376]
MPKIGMEPVRRKALVDAALRVIGDHGSLSVTMSEIARQAGVSAALAHHYFGSKEQLLIETIRSLLRRLRDDAVMALKAADTPREKISAIIRVSFQADQFAPETIAAWLAFYAEAQRSEETRRFLVIYARRLRSNLLASLKALCPLDAAERIAEGAAAMIDGLYIRQSLKSAPISIEASIGLTEDYVTALLARPYSSPPREKGPLPQAIQGQVT